MMAKRGKKPPGFKEYSLRKSYLEVVKRRTREYHVQEGEAELSRGQPSNKPQGETPEELRRGTPQQPNPHFGLRLSREET